MSIKTVAGTYFLLLVLLSGLSGRLLHEWTAHGHEEKLHCEAQNEQHLHDDRYASTDCDLCDWLNPNYFSPGPFEFAGTALVPNGSVPALSSRIPTPGGNNFTPLRAPPLRA